MSQGQKARQSQITPLRVAIAHDSFLYEGGAERVLRHLLKLFPRADVSIALIKPVYRAQLAHTHRVTSAPFSFPWLPERCASFLKPLVRWWWRSLDLTAYDLVISSSHSFSAKAVVVHPPARHIAYIHTPPRFLYREFNEMGWLKRPPFAWIFKKVLAKWRALDRRDAQGPDVLIANSHTTQRRIKQYYGRNSTVIFPPVAINHSKPYSAASQASIAPQPYFLFHSRLVKQKGAKLVIQAFNRLRLPLVVVGTGPEKKRLERLAGPTITFLGFVPDQLLEAVYAKARALVFASQDEDFGMVPVEAMAHGVPVIAYRSGAVTETVVPGKTGLLFDEYSLESLQQAVRSFERKDWSATACRRQASRFSAAQFTKQFMRIVAGKHQARTKV